VVVVMGVSSSDDGSGGAQYGMQMDPSGRICGHITH
jgi:hypothetical protein